MPSTTVVRTAVVDAAGNRLRADAAASYLRMLAAGMPAGGVDVFSRTMAQQQRLYDLYRAGKGPIAARPSATAPHIDGRAMDLHTTTGGKYAPSAAHVWLTKGGDGSSKPKTGEKLRAHDYGWRRTVPSERWHFEYDRSKDKHRAADLKARLAKLGYKDTKAFQRAHGLTVDGVDGPLTWAVLLGKPKPAPTPPKPSPVQPDPADTLALRVASINVRSADPKIDKTGAKTWPGRSKDLIAAIVAADAAVILCQETVEDQRDAIRDALPGGPKRWLVWVRRGQAIIWDSQRLTHGPKTDILVNSDGFHGAVATTLTDPVTGLAVTVCSAHVAPTSVIPADDKVAVQRAQTGKIIADVDALASGGVRIIGGDFNNVAAAGWAAPYWDANDTAEAAATYRDAPTRDTRRIDLLLYRMGSQHTIACRGYGQRDTKTGSDHALIVTSLRITRKTTT